MPPPPLPPLLMGDFYVTADMYVAADPVDAARTVSSVYDDAAPGGASSGALPVRAYCTRKLSPHL